MPKNKKVTFDFSKVLITGASGMVGSYVDFGIKTDHRTMDVTSFDEVFRVVRKHKPTVIIHLAAETDVDRCDKDQNNAYLVNGVGTYNVAAAALHVGAKIVYVSTAGIFDGEKKGLYKENDSPNPKNFYGHSKYMGELIVRGMFKDYIIARGCWMFGGGPKKDLKFVAKIIRQFDNPEVKAVSDAFGSPTFGKDLISAIKQLLIEDARGVFNLGNEGSCSRYEVAKVIAEVLKPNIKVTPVGLDYFPGANRVKNEAMVSKVKLMRPWKEALVEYLETEWKNTTKN